MTQAKPSIAVLGGTGHEGAGLAARWARAGYRVVIGSRDAARAAEAASELARASGGDVTGASNAEAAASGEIGAVSATSEFSTSPGRSDGRILPVAAAANTTSGSTWCPSIPLDATPAFPKPWHSFHNYY